MSSSIISYTFVQIATILQGHIVELYKGELVINRLLLDSRQITFPETALFFAIVGEHYNAHKFLTEVYEKGVRNFVVSQAIDPHLLPNANVVLVADTVAALQLLASYHREQFNVPVIGITGSNGKTVVKEWLFQLLHKQYYVVRSPQSYNSQVGVPLSVWQMSSQHQLAIFEAGISQPTEMARLQTIIQPTIGIFTNIGTAHSKGFETQKLKVFEKLQLFKNVKCLIYRADYELITDCIAQLKQQNNSQYGFETLAWSTNKLLCSNSPILYFAIDKHPQHTRISTIFRQKPLNIQIPFSDDAAIENAIHTCLLCLQLGLSLTDIERQMKHLQPIAMRLELKAGINNCVVINDAYNADLQSLAIALDFLAQQQQLPQKTLILSDILESGQHSKQLYKAVADLVIQHKIDHFIGIGNKISANKILFKQINAQFYANTAQFLAANLLFENQTILLKGARTFAFENIAQLLVQKIHTTTLEINLNAIAHNIKVYRQLLQPDTKLMVMVKAFGYGSGGAEVANILQYNKVDYLAVAYTDEGVALRKAGIKLPIMVMNPQPNTFEAIVRYKLEPEIYSLSHLQKWERFLLYLNKAQIAKSIPHIHLKIDTGMHRLGFEETDIDKLVQTLKNNDTLRIASVFSHLAATDSTEHDVFTQQQISLFNRIHQVIQNQTPYKIMRHILNTAGIIRFSANAQMDMVRLGIGCYGVDSTGTIQRDLMNVSTLKTYISQIKKLAPTETVGYSRRGVLHQTTKIATISIGYGDGLPRCLSNGKGKMWINGQLAPIIGNVCMDMTMLDISHIDNVQEGDEVIVFGEKLPVQQVAHWANTIAYEILTGVSGRVKRVYFQE